MREKIENGTQVDMERLVEDLKILLRDGQELLRAGLGRVKEQARFGAERTNVYVREKPYQTIGIAFGIGILAGVLTAGLLKGSDESQEEED